MAESTAPPAPKRKPQRRADSIRLEAEFRARLAELGATLLEPEYLGSDKPHRVLCREQHEGTPRPTDVARGKGVCRTCVRRAPAAAEAAFRARVEELGGVVLEPVWRGVDKPHRVRCAEGHENTPRPSNVRKFGNICRTCAGLDPRVAKARFQARLTKLGAVLLEDVWRGTAAAYRVRCSRGHEISVRPINAQRQGALCRACSDRAWTTLYVVRDADTVKIGITSADPSIRLGAHAHDGLSAVVRLYTGLPEGIAPEIERVTLAALRDAQEEPVRGKEYFPARTLPLVLDVVDNHPIIRKGAKGCEQLI